jgi:hypothetical protein
MTLRGAPQLSLTVFTETRQAGMRLYIALVYRLRLEGTLNNHICFCEPGVKITMSKFNTFGNI